MSEDDQRDTARRALLGDIDALRQLLDSTAGQHSDDNQVLRSIVESALQARGYSINEVMPAFNQSEIEHIPVLTETADGQNLRDETRNLRKILETESEQLINETVQQYLPAMEQQLRLVLQEACRRHIDHLLDEPRQD